MRTIATYLSESFWSVAGIYNNVEYLPQLGIAFGAIAAAGLVWRAFTAQHQEVALSPCCKQYLTAMAAAIALNLVLTARFGYLYNQGQGRFLFPLLIPIAVLMALGLQALAPRAPGERVPGLVAAFFSTYVLSFAAYSLAAFAQLAISSEQLANNCSLLLFFAEPLSDLRRPQRAVGPAALGPLDRFDGRSGIWRPPVSSMSMPRPGRSLAHR